MVCSLVGNQSIREINDPFPGVDERCRELALVSVFRMAGEAEISGRVEAFCSTYQLSPRERQIVDLICRGHHPKAVADLVGCGYESVRTHLRRMYKKAGCSGVRELVLRIFSEG